MTAELDAALGTYAAESERSVDIRGSEGRGFGAVLDECLAQNGLMRGAYDSLFRVVSAMLDAGGPPRRPLALYGLVSPMCVAAKYAFERQGIGVACLCVPQPAGRDDLYGTPIVAPAALDAECPGAVVVVCVQPHDEQDGACPVLASLGLPPERVIPFAFMETLLKQDPMVVCRPKQSLAPPDPAEFRRHLDRYSWAYDFFEDDLSKLTVLAWLRKKLCRTQMDVASPCEKYYEAGFVELGKREIFVDGGAYAGESVVDFVRNIEAAKGGYARVWSFEPSAGGYARTAEALRSYPNVTVAPKGLWSCDATLSFFEEPGQASSFVCVPEINTFGGRIEAGVPVTSLDAVFGGLPDAELPTFIKMDIEGAEREALLGGAQTIARAKPKMAICAYHKPEDLYALPQTIMKIRGDYRFALRQHEPELHEIILYAV